MDVSVHTPSAQPPEWLAPLLEALQAHAEDRDTPDGLAVFCPDATVDAPPALDAGFVAFVPDTSACATREGALALRAALVPWVARGATLLTPTPTSAQRVRDLTGLPAGRARVLCLPAPTLPPPVDGPPAPDTVLAIDPIDAASVFGAVRAARLAGRRVRLIVSGPRTAAWVRPGGICGLYELLGGHDAVHVQDWRDGLRDAAAIVLGDPVSELGVELRQALACGRPLLVPESPIGDAHLDAVGASALRYPAGDVAALTAALLAATDRDGAARPQRLADAATVAVRAETSAPAAAVLFNALCDSVASEGVVHSSRAYRNSDDAPPPLPADPDRVRVLFFSPLPAFGGHATIIRSFVRCLCADPRRPAVTVVAAADAGPEGGLMADVLTAAGAHRTRLVAMHLVDQALAEEVTDVDVVYSAWPHTLEPPAVPVPLITTFYDMNWRHFDHLSAEEKQRLDAQTPRWLASAKIVCSSEFIASELQEHFGADASAIPIVPTPAPAVLPAPSATAATAVRTRFALPERFLLCPAGHHPSKNYAVLHAACRALRAAGSPVSVVATGVRTERFVGPDLIGLGYVDAADLRALLELSAGVVQPTLYEAGSFPMLEALTVGRPAAVSDIPAISEQVRRWDLRVESFDARDPQSCARAMRAVLDGARDGDAAHNARAVGNYTWPDFAARYLDVMYACAGASSSVSAPVAA